MLCLLSSLLIFVIRTDVYLFLLKHFCKRLAGVLTVFGSIYFWLLPLWSWNMAFICRIGERAIEWFWSASLVSIKREDYSCPHSLWDIGIYVNILEELSIHCHCAETRLIYLFIFILSHNVYVLLGHVQTSEQLWCCKCYHVAENIRHTKLLQWKWKIKY